ncbi:PhnD/SsuA/transferrin family substrate-binding protein [Rhodovulum strictum]|uniref:PhnD/SsuA/transferrin family substrate-binding protein n=1 Tax=Rhodovulum strictum TaxID=58314 RepID=A0A844B562_9RHOB|nr:PhnD/SsuA/transferrin family substrate-binding protein [Rhodovulum strictum]MRH21341.1 PhnD/SsuA/transferrin family substrate-binding protein [Rhodovulum strictum]
MFRTLIGATALATALAMPAMAEALRFGVTDIEGMEAMQQEFGAFEKALEAATGHDIELYAMSSRTSAVEAINQGQVDLILTGPAEYVVIKELADPVIVAGWQRPNYYAQVVVLANGPVKSVQDLRGKRVTFGSIGSTSQHLGPAQVLADLGLKLDTDYRGEIIGRNVAVEALIRGDVQAVGMSEGHLKSIREAFPETGFTVIARGRDLPNDILVARKDLAPELIETVRKAFAEQGDALMAAVLQGDDNQKYNGGFFLTEIKDSDYDYVRSMYATIGVDTKSFVGD